MTPTGRSALVAGATGLVGGELVRQLAERPSYARVAILLRRPPETPLPGRVEPVLVDYEQLDRSAAWFAVDDVFCALGTTIRQAGSQAAFRRVDHDYVVAVARLARERGARHFLLVSTVFADAASRAFYNRVKGEVEEAVRALGYPSLTIARPSLLLGNRPELRLGEELVKPLGWFFPRAYRPIHARHVAAALIGAAERGAPGEHVLQSADMQP